MSSFAQVVVGGVLLVTAFLFGRYINDQPILPNNGSDKVVASGELNRQVEDRAPSQSLPPKKNNSLQRTLRDRILGDRIKNRVPQQQSPLKEVAPTNQVATTTPFQLPEQEIVVPNFSHLELSPVEPLGEISESNSNSDQTAEAKPTFSRLPRKNESLPRMTFSPSKDREDNPIKAQAERRPNAIQSTAKKSPLPNNSTANTKEKEITVRRGKFKLERPKNEMVPVRHRESKLTSKSDQFLSYKTVFGDTLHSISSHFFGKPDYYLDIYLANKDQLVNPATVPANITLRIPVMDELVNGK